MPKVSIIIPNYNHAKFLKQRIDSVLNQSYQNFEVIILDDCSTDDSLQIIEKYKQYPKISNITINSINSGSPFKQWAKGIELAKGDYIWIAESDDWAEDDFLALMVKKMDANTNAGICFCNSNWIDEEGTIGKDLSIYERSFERSGIEEIKDKLLKYNTIQNASACLFRKKMITGLTTGLEKYKACGDWLFYIRILYNSNLVYLEDKLNNFRWYHQNTSNAAIKSGLAYKESLQLIYDTDINKLGLSLIQKTALIKFWYYKTKGRGYLHTYKNMWKLIVKLVDF